MGGEGRKKRSGRAVSDFLAASGRPRHAVGWTRGIPPAVPRPLLLWRAFNAEAIRQRSCPHPRRIASDAGDQLPRCSRELPDLCVKSQASSCSRMHALLPIRDARGTSLFPTGPRETDDLCPRPDRCPGRRGDSRSATRQDGVYLRSEMVPARASSPCRDSGISAAIAFRPKAGQAGTARARRTASSACRRVSHCGSMYL